MRRSGRGCRGCRRGPGRHIRSRNAVGADAGLGLGKRSDVVEEGVEGVEEEVVWARVGVALGRLLLVLRGRGRVGYRSVLRSGEEEIYVVSIREAWEAWRRKG